MKSFTLGKNGETIMLTGWGFSAPLPKHDVLRLIALDQTGELLWHRSLKITNVGFDTLMAITAEIESSPVDGSLYVISQIRRSSANAKPDFRQIIIKTDSTGKPLLWKKVATHGFDKIFARKDGIYLLGSTRQPLPFSKNKKNCLLAKLDHDLQLVWARAYSGEEFEYSRASLNFFPNGSMALGYSTRGAFPTILARLDAQGNVLSQQGYPLYEPQIEVLSDGSLVMMTQNHFDSTGKIFTKLIISKTNPDGSIDGCETFPACLDDGPVAVEFEPFDLEEIPDNTSVSDYPVEEDSLEFPFAPFCEIPAAPAPDFFFPDTVCLGDTARTSATRNILADSREWEISQNGQTKTIRDSLNIGIRFDEAGSYKVSQKIWFLGCEYEAQRVVQVLPPLELKIQPAVFTCVEPPVELSAKSNRPLVQFDWSGGPPLPTISVLKEGWQTLTASDGTCSATDSVEVFFHKNCPARIYFPTVFTPDGDGLNDEFAPQGEGFVALKLTIFDRWGNIWHDGPGAWKPQRAQPGVFTYLFEFRETATGERKFLSGSVTVAR